MLKIIPLVVLATTCFAEPSELVDSLDTADPAKQAYRNPSLPTEVRVKDLLSRMTVDEKPNANIGSEMPPKSEVKCRQNRKSLIAMQVENMI